MSMSHRRVDSWVVRGLIPKEWFARNRPCVSTAIRASPAAGLTPPPSYTVPDDHPGVDQNRLRPVSARQCDVTAAWTHIGLSPWRVPDMLPVALLAADRWEPELHQLARACSDRLGHARQLSVRRVVARAAVTSNSPPRLCNSACASRSTPTLA
jgi:hypothetical protein